MISLELPAIHAQDIHGDQVAQLRGDGHNLFRVRR